MDMCDTCNDRSRGDLSKNALKPVQKVRPPNGHVCVHRSAPSFT
jgi:hypothetical protein